MNTTSRKPDSVSSVNITPAEARSLRTICWTAADRATSAWAKPVVHAVGDRAVVVERGEHVADRLEHVVDAADVEEGLLLAGERSLGQILGRCGGAHGEGGFG